MAKNVAPRTPLESHRRPVAVPRFKSKSECLIRGRTLDHKITSLALYRQLSAAETPTPVTFSLLSGMMCPLHRWKATGVLLLFRETQGTKGGDAGYRSPYLSHAKRALYHVSYVPLPEGFGVYHTFVWVVMATHPFGRARLVCMKMCG